MTMRVLFDGWPALYEPNGPAASHLLAVLAQFPEGIEPVVALPGSPPGWFPKVETLVHATAKDPRSRLHWEQRALPGMLAETQAQLLHLMRPNLPLLASKRSVLSPTGFDLDQAFKSQGRRKSGFVSRLREALGTGGLSRVGAILWPSDLPRPKMQHPLVTLPPHVHPDFAFKPGRNGGSNAIGELQLPDTYILYHGPHERTDLQRLIAAWSWAAGPIGVYYPLVLLGLDQAAGTQLSELVSAYELKETMISLPEVSPQVIVQLYKGCSALFHPAPISPWGGPVRQALACGKPVVALEDELTGAMVGPGAYLIPVEDLRKVGAALITSIVEEEVAQSLSQSARQQAASWQSHTFKAKLAAVYRNLA